MITNRILIEGAKIGFRNFSGKESDYNAAGDRNFCVFIDKELAHKLEEDGWNVKWTKPRDDQDDPSPFLPVKVNYKNRPPKITMIVGGTKQNILEDDVHILDWCEIEKVDLSINPYNWTVRGKEGVKAYVNAMRIYVIEDEFSDPDSAVNAMCTDCLSLSGSCVDCPKND